MHLKIAAALDAICNERDDRKYMVAFDAAAELAKTLGESGLADIVFSEIPRTVPYELVAELFDLLAWQTNDNGASVNRAVEQWLREGTDNRKLLIALHLEVFPFVDEQEMKAVLTHLAESNQRVSARCHELLRARAKQSQANLSFQRTAFGGR